MNVDLNYEQRARLELIAVYSGKSPAQVLIDAAQFLLNCEADYYPPCCLRPSSFSRKKSSKPGSRLLRR